MRRTALVLCRLVAAVATVGSLLALLALLAPLACAEGTGTEPTAMSVGAPTAAELGQRVTLQARLVDSSGTPIEKAVVYFVTPTAFLSGSGDVEVAQATTDKQGLAVTQYEVRAAGPTTIRAEFRGDDRFAPSSVEAQMAVSGDRQLYVETAGVRIPGLNAAPAVAGLGSAVSPLWPSMSGWPIALALLVVWSMYGLVVVLIFRVAMAGMRGRASLGPARTRETTAVAATPAAAATPNGARPAARQQEATS